MTEILRDFEFRSESREDTDGDGHTLSGYAAVFNQDTEINSFEGRFVERIAPGAFKKTLHERKPVMQYDHGRDSRVGSVPIGKYTVVKEDDHGLYTEGRLFTNSLVEPVRQAIEGEAISGMSFKFQVVRDEWRDRAGKLLKGDKLRQLLWDGAEGLVRTIKEVKLYEAGPVSTPAYFGTSVGVRSASETPEELRETYFESYTRTMIEPVEERSGLGDNEPSAETDDELRASKKKPPFVKDDDEEEDEDDPKDSDSNDKPSGGKKKPSSDSKPSDDDDKPEGEDDEDEEDPKSKKKTPPKKRDAADDSTSRTGDAPEQDAARQGTSATRDSIKNRIERTRAMTLTELKERLAYIDVRSDEINTEYRDAELPADEAREYEELKAERSKVAARIAAVEARMAEIAGSAGSTRTERAFGAPAVHIKKDIYDVDSIRSAAPTELRDNAQRAIDEAKMGGGSMIAREDAQENALRTLGLDDESGTLARRVLTTGSDEYTRAWGKAIAAGTPQVLFGDEARSLSLGADGNGGYAVPFQLDPTVILTSAGVVDPLRQIARVERITGKEWQGITSAGVSVSRAGEADEASDNSFSLVQPTVRTQRVQGFIPFSYELAESWSAVQSEITRALADAKGREEADSFMNDVYHATTAPDDANGLLAELTSGNGNLLETEGESAFAVGDVYALEGNLDARYRHANSKFLANHSIYNVIRQFASEDGHALWERIGAGRPNQLLGYEALESTAMTNGTADNAKILLFGDFSNFLIVDRIGMSVELIPQVFGTARNMPTGQRGIFAIWMNNAKLLVPKAIHALSVKETA